MQQAGWLSSGLSARILVLAILVSSLFMPFAMAATTLSFNPVGLDPDNLHFYNSSGTLIGIYNTSSTAIALTDNESYTILVAPANANLLGNHPTTWFQNLIDKANENSVSLVIMFLFVGVILAAIARRR